MFRRITVLFITMTLLIMTGCSDNSPDKAEINSDELAQTSSNAHFMIPFPDMYESNDELLLNVGAVKFSELDKSQIEPLTIEPLEGLMELYKPGYLKPSFVANGIAVAYINRITLYYLNAATEEVVGFIWQMSIPAENATEGYFDRGAAAEYIEEYNGITYGVTEWVNETGEHTRYLVSWAQYGQTFSASLPASFTLEEVLAFCYAQPIEAWELLGDAVSVSIQGMENVNIYDDGYNAIIVEDDILYKDDGHGNMDRVGYRWLIDESTSRYQYVLEPNEYIFSSDNAISEPELLLKYFEAGECVYEEDYTEVLTEEFLTQFSLSIATNHMNNTITLK